MTLFIERENKEFCSIKFAQKKILFKFYILLQAIVVRSSFIVIFQKPNIFLEFVIDRVDDETISKSKGVVLQEMWHFLGACFLLLVEEKRVNIFFIHFL